MGLFDLVSPRITEIGKIKIGCKEEKVRKTKGGSEWRAPRKLDHFLITGLERTPAGDLKPDAELMASLAKRYADPDGKLRRLPIMVCSNDIEDIVQARYVWYAGRKVAAYSDGVTVTWRGDPYKMKFMDKEVVEQWNPSFAELEDPKGNRLFKLHAVFNCMIAAQNARWGGVYKLRTTSTISANQLVGSLIHIHELTGGVLRGLPMQLVVRPQDVAPKGIASKVYVVHCELVGADLLEIRQKALELARSEAENSRQLNDAKLAYKRLLQAPGEGETPEESLEVVAEFHPEVMEDAEPSTDQDSPTEDVEPPHEITMEDLVNEKNGQE